MKPKKYNGNPLNKFFYLYYSHWTNEHQKEALKDTLEDFLVDYIFSNKNKMYFKSYLREGFIGIANMDLASLILESTYQVSTHNSFDKLVKTLDKLFDPITLAKATSEFIFWYYHQFIPPFHFSDQILLPYFLILTVKPNSLEIEGNDLSHAEFENRKLHEYQDLLECFQLNYDHSQSFESQLEKLYYQIYELNFDPPSSLLPSAVDDIYIELINRGINPTCDITNR